jgi:hypothetical protein
MDGHHWCAPDQIDIHSLEHMKEGASPFGLPKNLLGHRLLTVVASAFLSILSIKMWKLVLLGRQGGKGGKQRNRLYSCVIEVMFLEIRDLQK